MEFYAYHGVYAEEQKIGNLFEVTLSVDTDFRAGASSDDLTGTIDYGELYAIVAQVMAKRIKLLERIGHQIIIDIASKYPQAVTIEVIVSKHNPPIGGICAKSTIVINSADLD